MKIQTQTNYLINQFTVVRTESWQLSMHWLKIVLRVLINAFNYPQTSGFTIIEYRFLCNYNIYIFLIFICIKINLPNSFLDEIPTRETVHKKDLHNSLTGFIKKKLACSYESDKTVIKSILPDSNSTCLGSLNISWWSNQFFWYAVVFHVLKDVPDRPNFRRSRHIFEVRTTTFA